MQSDLGINNVVVIKAPNARLGQRGRVVNRFDRTWTLYAVQFDDNGIGYFDKSEVERIELKRNDGLGDSSSSLCDITELLTRP